MHTYLDLAFVLAIYRSGVQGGLAFYGVLCITRKQP